MNTDTVTVRRDKQYQAELIEGLLPRENLFVFFLNFCILLLT